MAARRPFLHRPRALIGMVHVPALPGTPKALHTVTEIAAHAAAEAKILADAGFDAILVENMHDAPYLARVVGPEIVAAMTACVLAVRQAVAIPVGVQILAGANMAALAVAHAASGAFIRAEGFVFSAVADEGVLASADAGPLLRYRRQIGAEGVLVAVDIRKKHSSHALTHDLDVAAHARAAEFFGAEALIVTGPETGRATSHGDLRAVREASSLPLIVGSGATPNTLPMLLEVADAVIVGSALKRDGHWASPLDPARLDAMVRARA
ncbi:MAG: BtpA/SgcQ family protein [Phycisphaeraceae bacterium]|nr:BtpA/SgcQ family protein [Phycisphaeraceae bacterium]